MHQTSIPKKTNKVQFELPQYAEKKNTNFMSSEFRVSRKTTIQHNKMNIGTLQRFSMLVAGKEINLSF